MDERIAAALAGVHDPCSIAAGRPTSLVDMGLVTGWTLVDGTLSVTFCVTFAGCTMAPHFTEAARVELAKIAGVERVEVTVDPGFAWTPERQRRAPLAMRGTPQAWRAGRAVASSSSVSEKPDRA